MDRDALRKRVAYLRSLPLKTILGKLGRLVWSTNTIILLRRPAGKAMDEHMRKPCPGTFRVVTPEIVDDGTVLSEGVLNGDWPSYCRALLERGDVVRYGYLGGKCVYRHALRFGGSLSLSGREYFQLEPEDVYGHAAFCAPEARGKGFHGENHWWISGNFSDRTFYGEIKPDNVASLRVACRVGEEPVMLVWVKHRFFFRSRIHRREYTPEEARKLVEQALGKG